MTQTDYDILVSRAEAAAKIQNEILDLKSALTWLKSSAFNFYLGSVPFSEVPPGTKLPQETWDALRKEIISGIESRIKELQQQFKEL